MALSIPTRHVKVLRHPQSDSSVTYAHSICLQRQPRPLSSTTAPGPLANVSRAHQVASRPIVIATATSKAAGGKGATKGKGFGAANAPSVSKSGVPQTCACGSKHVYRECCEPYHLGAAVPADVEAALRARFCAFVKGRMPYLLSTFHPSYLEFKYDGSELGGAAAQLRRDVEAAVKRFNYSNLKVLEVQPGAHEDEAYIAFRYSSVNKFNPEKNYDGTIKISTTVERSRFVRDPSAKPDADAAPAADAASTAARPWRFADYTLIDYPSWMEDAKKAELRARGHEQGEEVPAAAGAATA